MTNLISKMAVGIRSLMQSLQIKHFLPVVLAGALLLATTPGSEPVGQGTISDIKETIEQKDTSRPSTTRQWKEENRELQGSPGKQLKRIGKETADAVKDMGQLYPDVAERTIPAVGDK